MADKKQIAFVSAIAIVAVAGVYSFISDFITTFKETKPKLVETKDLKEEGEILNDFWKSQKIGMPLNNINENELEDFDFDTIGYVVSVVDGDTICVDIDDINGDEDDGSTIRLIGVDVPDHDIPHGDNGEKSSAKNLLKTKLKPKDLVYIRYDKNTEDEHGNVLAYVYFSNGMLIEDWLIRNGYASTNSESPNTMYADRFSELESQARNDKYGIWSEE